MKQRWTLQIENFVKIKKAEIDIRPFTLLVGENNTGKSYVATLIWGLWSISDLLFTSHLFGKKPYENCLNILNYKLNKLKHNESIVINNEEQQVFIDFFNKSIEDDLGKKALLQLLFSKDITADSIQIKNFRYEDDFKLYKKKHSLPFIKNEGFISVSEEIVYLNEELQNKEQGVKILYDLIKAIINSLLFSGYYGQPSNEGFFGSSFPLSLGPKKNIPLFLPASRTGFMLSYPALVSDRLNITPQSIDLILPIRLFLQNLINKRNIKNNSLEKIAIWLEKELLNGKVQRDEGQEIPRYQYQMKANKQSLPMHLVSSLVAEVTPIVHFLRYFNNFSALFIEEPEAHLHPSAQRVMARALAKINNSNVPLVVTTHGDTLFQQLNNLVVLYGHNNQKELLNDFGYGSDEVIDPNNIIAYQFKNNGDETTVTKLESSEYGIPVPTFNEPLEELFNEINKLHNG